ncbi:MAG: hypothetical protein EXQ85_00710 [Alphaproteobacteria bacterium]|nr:hypothetical protein [Alphaproteobacteria bacterium]
MPFNLTRLGQSFGRVSLGLIALTVLSLHIGVLSSRQWLARPGSSVSFAFAALNWDLVGGGAPVEGYRDPMAEIAAATQNHGNALVARPRPESLSSGANAGVIRVASGEAYRPVVGTRTPAAPELPVRAVSDDRKSQFIWALLPVILRVNDAIIQDRERIEELQLRDKAGLELTDDEWAWLNDLAEEYEIEAGDFASLLHRHDVIPPSLALAQAIEESGWGTSRFAQEGNAVFGRWTLTKGAGIVPHRREPGKGHEIRAFDEIDESVADYVRNLNRHNAYRAFRARREAMRKRGSPFDSYALAATLSRYSERGEKYVQTLRTIIRGNDLTSFDRIQLRDIENNDS